MPVDTTGKPSRQPRRPPTEEEQKDIDIKRLRGELSCAECRRLKLKCDKTVPCGSCVRRGCESICPCGILSAGQGTRFILADTDQLHSKIAEMSQRIRQLEEALAIVQALVSNERHPLLATDLLAVKFAAEAPKAEPPSHTSEQALEGLGTLTLTDAGEVKYFGRSAGSETLLVMEDYSDDEEDELEAGIPPLPPDIAEMGAAFPAGRPNAVKLACIRTLLPPLERATHICESWLLHGALFFRPIKRDELLGPFLQAIYAPPALLTPTGDDPHALATLFFILALGLLLDLSLPPYNAQAERFYAAGKAALALRAVYDAPGADTVRAIGLMATYHSLCEKKYSRDSAWGLMSIAAKVAQSIGLHRDCARWHMNPVTVQMRRTLFWDVFCSDVSHSLALGRPPAIHLSYVDCEYPEDEESTLTDLGEIRPGFWRSKYIFARDIWMALAEATLAAQTPGYGTVLELDRKVRELSVPDSFKPYPTRADGEHEYHSSAASLRGFYASQYRTVTMIYIHRSFFAQSLLSSPVNPLRSPFATSFLTAYRSASVLIKATAYQYDRCAEAAMRVWFLLHHTFSAAVIAGTVVTLSPRSNMAASALIDLGLAVELFERTATQSHRAKAASAVLSKLKERALRAYTQSLPAPAPTSGLSAANPNPNAPAGADGEVTNELEIFGGQKRILALKQRHRDRDREKRGKSTTPDSPAASPSSGAGSGSGSLSAGASPTPGSMGIGAGMGTAAGHLGADITGVLGVSHPGGGGWGAGAGAEFPWLDDLLNPPADLSPLLDGGVGVQDADIDAVMGLEGMPTDVYQALYSQAQQDAQMLPLPPPQPFELTASAMAPHFVAAGVGGGAAAGGRGLGAGPGAGAMVELGLTSESGMDDAWLAFIQQCGVTLASSPVGRDAE